MKAMQPVLTGRGVKVFLFYLSLLLPTGVLAQGGLTTIDGSTQEKVWMCPIHSDYTAPRAGTCPRDGMRLVLSSPFDVRDYGLEFTTIPAIPRAGESLTLQFRVTHPDSGEVVTEFIRVHDQLFHLFVVSQDLDWFQHIHPVMDESGLWSIQVELQEAGYYKVLSDFLPAGGTSQFIAHSLVTSGYRGDIFSDGAMLVPDTTQSKTVDGLTATLAYDPDPFIAGLYGHLNFHFSDAETNEPVTDLQAYLGAFGHTLILSADLVDYVHSHPLDLDQGFDEETGPIMFMIPMGVDPDTLRGGPRITFDGLMPHAGLYRAFTQVRWRNTLRTFVFTFEVIEKP